KPRHRDVPIVVLTAADLGNVGLTTLARRQDAGASTEPRRGRHRAAESTPAQVAPPPPRTPTPVAATLTQVPPPALRPPAAVNQGAVVVRLGLDQGGAEVRWELSPGGSPPAFILGIPGQGKSVTTRSLIRQFAAQGLPSLVLDFHGDLAARAPAGSAVVDASAGLPFSPFELVTEERLINQSAWEIAEIVAYVCGLGEIERSNVYRGIQAAYQTALRDGARIPTMAEVADAVTAAEEGARGRNARDRIRPLTDFGLFEPVTGATFDPTAGPGAVVDVSRIGLERVQIAAS